MRTLLIDGDILVYQTATIVEKAIPWDDDGNLWTTHWHPEDGYSRMDTQLTYLKKELDADRVIVCLSDTNNFRKEIMPEYKANRIKTRKPFGIPIMRKYLEENYECFCRPDLEADDVMGILSTHPKLIPGEKIIVSIDKDMQSIPGKLLNLNRARRMLDSGEIASLDEAVVAVSVEDADRYHILQTLTGDATDGYTGCPGVGPETALKILEEPRKFIPVEHEIKRGPRKGQIETRWTEGDSCSVWEAVESAFLKAGLNEAEALQQARVARILRHSDYDFKKKRFIPWIPPN